MSEKRRGDEQLEFKGKLKISLTKKPRVEEVVEIRDDSSQAVDTHFSQSMSTPPAFSNNDLGQSPVEGKNGLSTSAPARPQVNGARRAGHTSSAGATVGGSLNSSGGPKKLVIKGFEKKPTLPADFEEERWRRLQGAVQAVYASRPVPASLEELYKAAEDLCSHRMAANLYRRLVGEMEEHIKSELGRLMERMASTSDALSFLTFLNAMWQDHCQHTLVIRSVFLYLDRTYVIQTPGIRSIWDTGLQLFRKEIAMQAEVQRRTVDGLLYLIERERNGETVDRSLIKSLLRMYGALGVYAEVFERPFLEATRTFYAREGEARMQEYDVAEYLRHVEARLQEEQERVLHYLDATTRRPLQQTLERYLLEAHVQALVEKGLNQLLREDRRADLARMYALFARVGALEKLRSGWNAYIKATGRELVLDTSPERERGLVEELLEFKARLDRVLEQSFARNDAFAYSLKEAFESFINARPNKPAELIAKFVDSKLRRGGSGSGKQALSEAELEAVLDRVMILFRYVQGKDVFEAFYKKDLAKRLLLGRSVSIEAEKSMISRLKAECGQNFTNKLEGMFKDIDLSRELTAQFRAWPRLQELAPRRTLEMHISVLTTGYWPNYPLLELKLPAQLQELQELFREFYQSKHSGRRLQWVHALAQCTLKAQFARGRKELSLSLVQACVLLLFNTAPGALSYQEIAAATGLEEKELKRTLASLALGKVRVLTRCQGSGSGPIQEEDSFRVNDDLTHKLFRIKINAAQLAETPEEAQKTHETVFADRQYQVDAAIVRIMKTRKSLSHAQLVAELYKQLRFPYKPADIKKRIESLIEREYLERDAQNHQQYNYLA